MEGGRRGESEFVCIPIKAIDEALKALLKCLGLHEASPSSSTTGSENHSMQEEAIIMEVTSRKITVRPKDQKKQNATPGRPGGVSKKPPT